MPKVVIEKSTTLPAKDAFEKVCILLENDGGLKKLDPGYTCDWDSTNFSGKATGKQFKANMTVKDSGAGSNVVIEVELPFALGLAKGLVKSTLSDKLKTLFG